MEQGIPIQLFEERTDMATVVPTSNTGVNLRPVMPSVFARSILPMVGSGGYSIPVIATDLTAGAVAKGTERESTAPDPLQALPGVLQFAKWLVFTGFRNGFASMSLNGMVRVRSGMPSRHQWRWQSRLRLPKRLISNQRDLQRLWNSATVGFFHWK